MEKLTMLIARLQTIERNADVEEYGDKVLPDTVPDVKEAIGLARELFVLAYGNDICDNVEFLRDSGYSIFIIERYPDGGLLIGIRTQKGVISFR
jgi:hypothetical protein